MTTKEDKYTDMNRNPTGKGGFGDNPQHRSDGRWQKEDSISYQYNMLIRLSVGEFNKWLEKYPEDKRTMAQDVAHKAVMEAREDLAYLKEITDRTEGKPTQRLEAEIDTLSKASNKELDEELKRLRKIQDSQEGTTDTQGD